MRIDQRFLNWGVFLILLGAIPLAVQQGLVPADAVAGWWRLWPLIIIGIGAGILLSRTPVAFLGGLTIAATLGVMLGALIATGGGLGNLGDVACDGGRATSAFAEQRGDLGGAEPSVRIEMHCGDVSVDAATGTGWSIAGTSDDGQPPVVDASADSLRVRSGNRNGGDGFMGFGRDREDWSMTVPDGLAAFDATLNAGRSRIDLSGSHVRDVDVHADAADVRVDLSGTAPGRVGLGINAGSLRVALPAGSFQASLDANAGSIGFCVPGGVAVRVRTNDNIAAGNNFDERGLVRSGTTWQSPGYDGAAQRIDVEATVKAGSIELNPEDGCR